MLIWDAVETLTEKQRRRERLEIKAALREKVRQSVLLPRVPRLPVDEMEEECTRG